MTLEEIIEEKLIYTLNDKYIIDISMYLSNLLLQSAALCCETVGLVMYLNQSEVCTCVVSSLKK